MDDPFASGNASAYGPQAWGGNPMPFESYNNSSQLDSSKQLMQWASLTDPRTLAASRMQLRALTQEREGIYNQANADSYLRNTTQGQMHNALNAAAVNAGMYGGGSVAQFAFGAQQLSGRSGLRMDIAGRNSGQQFMGGGFTTDLVAKYVMSGVRDRFFNPVTGMANSNAYGMDYGEMGGMMSALTSKGMFSGMNVGQMQAIRPGDTARRDEMVAALRKQNFHGMAAELADKDISGGGQVLMPNQDTFQKIGDIMENTSKMMASFRDVFGKGMSADKMIQEAEKLSGMSFGSVGSPQLAAAKLNDLKTKAQTFGYSTRQLLEMDKGYSMGIASLAANKFGGRPQDFAAVGSMATPYVMETGLSASRHRRELLTRARNGGAYARDFSVDDVMALSGQGLVNTMSESGVALEALYAAENMGSFSGQKDQIKALVQQYYGAGDKGTRTAIENKLSGILSQGGISVGSITKTMGGTDGVLMGMDPATRQGYIGGMHQQNNARNINTFKNVWGSGGLNFAGRYKDAGIGPAFMFDLMSSMDIDPILTAMEAGDMGTVQKILEENKEFLTKSPEEIMKQLDPKEAGMMREFSNHIINNKMAADMVSRKSEFESGVAQMTSFFAGRAYGDGVGAGGGWASNAFRGVAGSGDVSTEATMAYLRSTGKDGITDYTMGADGASLNIDAAGAKALDKQFGGKLSEALGTGSDFAAMAAALKTPSGMLKMTKVMTGNPDVKWGTATVDGRKVLSVADKEKFKAANSVLTDFDRALSSMILSGEITDEASMDNAVSQLEGMASDELEAKLQGINSKSPKNNVFLSKNKEGIDALMKAATTWGSDSMQYQAIQDQYSQTPDAVIKGLDERISHYKKLSEDESLDEDERKQHAKTARSAMGLKSSLEGGSGDNYIGKLSMVMGDEMVLDVFQKMS